MKTCQNCFDIFRSHVKSKRSCTGCDIKMAEKTIYYKKIRKEAYHLAFGLLFVSMFITWRSGSLDPTNWISWMVFAIFYLFYFGISFLYYLVKDKLKKKFSKK